MSDWDDESSLSVLTDVAVYRQYPPEENRSSSPVPTTELVGPIVSTPSKKIAPFSRILSVSLTIVALWFGVVPFLGDRIESWANDASARNLREAIESDLLRREADRVRAGAKSPPSVPNKKKEYNDDDDLTRRGRKKLNNHLLRRERAHHSSSPPVPRLLHIVYVGPELPHRSEVVSHIRALASRQGYETRVWSGSDADQLIHVKYSKELRRRWNEVKATKEWDRMASFAKWVVLHRFGGVYLDADSIPCGGLDDLIGDPLELPGAASFPFVEIGSDDHLKVNDRAFAAPPDHPILRSILDVLARDGSSASTGNAEELTRSGLLTRAVRDYAASKKDAAPLPASPAAFASGWVERGDDLRLGSFTHQPSGASRSSSSFAPPGELDLWHLDLPSPKSEAGGGFSKSRCVLEADMIRPFLAEGCLAPPAKRGDFADCGRATSSVV